MPGSARGVDDHGQVRALAQHADRGEIERARVARSKVRMPRSHRITRWLPRSSTYSAAVSHSSMEAMRTALEHDRSIDAPDLAQQRAVLHVLRTHQQDVGALHRAIHVGGVQTPRRSRAMPASLPDLFEQLERIRAERLAAVANVAARSRAHARSARRPRGPHARASSSIGARSEVGDARHQHGCRRRRCARRATSITVSSRVGDGASSARCDHGSSSRGPRRLRAARACRRAVRRANRRGSWTCASRAWGARRIAARAGAGSWSGAQLCERLAHRRVVDVALEVDVEQVLPGRVRTRARLELGQVEVALRRARSRQPSSAPCSCLVARISDVLAATRASTFSGCAATPPCACSSLSGWRCRA